MQSRLVISDRIDRIRDGGILLMEDTVLRFQTGLGAYDTWYCAIYDQHMLSHIGVLIALATLYGRNLIIQETPVFKGAHWRRICSKVLYTQ